MGTKKYLGGPGGLTSNLGLPKFQGRKTSSQCRYMYSKRKIVYEIQSTGGDKLTFHCHIKDKLHEEK